MIPYLTVKYHHVEVTIENQVATTRIDQVFINDYDREIEGTYIFPLPEDAAISTFDMWVDGKKLEGRVLPKDEARRIYEEIVRSRRDPALLEYVGRNAFQARIFPIPARGEKRVQIEYSQLLAADNGLVKYVYPLNTEKFSPKPLKDVSVSVQIKAARPSSPSTRPATTWRSCARASARPSASYEAANVRPDKDFVLYYTPAGDDVGLNLLTYRPSGEDGYFLLLAAPKVEVDASKVVPKDVILVLDTSGSMEGKKIAQAKDALRFVLDHLNDADRFNIVTFNTAVTRYADSLRPAADRAAARKFVDDIRADGSTNIDGALREAFQGLSSERPAVVIFLTDGLPTAGVTDAGKIAANASKAAAKIGAPLPLRRRLRREHRAAGHPGDAEPRRQRLRQARGEPGGGRSPASTPRWASRCSPTSGWTWAPPGSTTSTPIPCPTCSPAASWWWPGAIAATAHATSRSPASVGRQQQTLHLHAPTSPSPACPIPPSRGCGPPARSATC